MSGAEERLATLIRDIYDASLDEEHWEVALQHLSDFFGAVGGTVHALTNDRTLLVISPDIAEATAEYQAEWWREDPLVKVARSLNLRNGIFEDRYYLPEEVIKKGAFYQDFLVRHGLGSVTGVLCSPVKGTTYSVALQAKPGFALSEERRRIFSIVGEHFSRAAMMGTLLQTVTAERDALLSGYDRFVCAVAIVGFDGVIAAANQRLYGLAGNGLSVRNNRFVAENHHQQRDLDAFLMGTARGTIDPSAPAVFVLQRETSPIPLVLRAVPIRPERLERSIPTSLRPASSSVWVMVMDAEAKADDDNHAVLRAMGLTKAQARVAYLLGTGTPPAEIAVRLGVGQSTVRTTIKSIYARLGIGRQADLARIVTLIRPLGSL